MLKTILPEYLPMAVVCDECHPPVALRAEMDGVGEPPHHLRQAGEADADEAADQGHDPVAGRTCQLTFTTKRLRKAISFDAVG